ncbi:MAG: CAP domain-containing protein [Bacteroidales bacterium]|nr:CAP domain-containing protein [Bacteroidales bacterium]
MIRICVVSILILKLICTDCLSQSSYYAYDHTNFRDIEIFSQVINLDSIDFPRINAVMFYITNEIRNKKKLPVLKYNALLEESATLHSKEMVKRDFFDHINKRNKKLQSPNDRALYCGIANPHLAENIAESFVLKYKAGEKVYPGGKGVFRYKPEEDPISPHTYLSVAESTLSDWMNSPNHKKNILSADAVELGCGTAYFIKKDFNDMPSIYATQNFQLFEPVRQDNENEK